MEFPLKAIGPNWGHDPEATSTPEFQDFLDSLDQPAFAVRFNGIITLVNPIFEKTLRRTPHNLIGAHWADLLRSAESDSAKHFFQTGIPPSSRKNIFTFVTSEGTAKPLQVQFSPVPFGDGDVFLAVCRDPLLEHPLLSIFQKRFEIEALVCKLSAGFLMIDGENIEATITSSLENIGRYIQADHAFLFLLSEDEKTVEKVFEWSLSGIFSRKGRISGISLSVIQNTKASGIMSRCNSPSCLVSPPMSQQEIEYLRSRGIHTHLGLPLKVKGRTIGYLGVDGCQADRAWADEDLSLLRLTAELFANSLLRFRAERKFQTTDSKYRALMRNFTSGMVLLFDQDIRFVMAAGENLRNLKGFRKSLEGKPVVDFFPEDRFPGIHQGIREVLKGRDSTMEVFFKEDWYEMRFAPVRNPAGEVQFGMIIAMVITPRKRIEEELRQVRLQEENTAVQIQQTLLASEPPRNLQKAEFGLCSCPSLLVDGDFTDFIILNDHIIDIVIGDVMGKGISAALIGASTKEAVLRIVTRLVGSGHGVLPRVEAIIAELQKDIGPRLERLSVFVTMVYCRIDLGAGTITIMNAGHPAVLVLGGEMGEIASHPSESAPLGLRNDVPLTNRTTGFSTNDRLLLVSDGVLEARNKQGDFFGEDRLRKLFRETSSLPPQATAEAILKEVRGFAGPDNLHDDFTCLVVDLR